jgi:hypothetical protein
MQAGRHRGASIFAALAAIAFLEPVSALRADEAGPLTAKDLGARYGQALGVLEICHGTKLTDKAKTLGDAFSGADQQDFKAQAAKVFDAWLKVKACSRPDDANQCKIMMDASCAAAYAEIGPGGSAVADLVTFPY